MYEDKYEYVEIELDKVLYGSTAAVKKTKLTYLKNYKNTKNIERIKKINKKYRYKGVKHHRQNVIAKLSKDVNKEVEFSDREIDFIAA